MHHSIERLINRDSTLSEDFTKAVAKWRELLANIDPTDPSEIAALAFQHQMWFENNCGGRWLGQEVMVWAGICMYYTTDTGFEGNIDAARAMYKGLILSKCSVEIHEHARDVAKSYGELTLDE